MLSHRYKTEFANYARVKTCAGIICGVGEEEWEPLHAAHEMGIAVNNQLFQKG
jgi:biotin synthase-like enzyme